MASNVNDNRINENIEGVERDLHWCDLATTLYTDEVFREWFQERFEVVARGLALEAIERPKTNADRNAASGILRFVKGKKSELIRYSSRKYRETLEKRLEVLYAKRERRGDSGARGRTESRGDLPFNTF